MMLNMRCALPEAGETLLHRLPLLDQSIATADRTITNLHAPWGYGKTTLVQAWGRLRQSRATTPLHLDLSGLDTSSPALPELIHRRLAEIACLEDLCQFADAEKLAATIGSLLTRAAIDVIILDHYPTDTPYLDALIGAIAAHTTGPLHFVIASRFRVMPMLQRNQRPWAFRDISRQDLGWTLTDIASALPLGAHVDAASIHEFTNGWPWAVDAVRSLLAEKPEVDYAAIVDRLTEPTGWAAAALEQGPFALLPATDIELLTCTAPLAFFEPDVVSAVTGDDDAWRALERLERNGLITETISEEKTAGFKCQPLVRALLMKRLQTRGTRIVQGVHHRAATHFLEKGALKQALRHAFAADDGDFATQAFLKLGGFLIALHYSFAELEESIDLLPAESLSNPRVRVAVAGLMIKSGRVGIGLEILREFNRVSTSDPPDPMLLRDIQLVEILAITLGVPSLGSAESRIASCLSSCSASEHATIQGIAYNLKCLGALNAGRFDQAYVLAETAAYFYEAAGGNTGLAHIRLHTSRIHRATGNIGQAVADLRTAKRLLLEQRRPDAGTLAYADIQLAAIHADQGDLPIAASLCVAALPQVERGELHWEALWDAYCLLADSKALEGDCADKVLHEGVSLARHNSLAELEAALRLKAVQRSIFNRSIEVESGFSELETVPKTDHWIVRHIRASVQAHLFSIAGHSEDGLALLDNEENACASSLHIRNAVEVHLDRAMILQSIGRIDDSLACVQTALAAAETSRLAAPFMERRDAIWPALIQMQTMLRDDADASLQIAFGSHILSQLLRHANGEGTILSKKERVVICGLASGRSNKEIARELSLSPETVRFHLKNVYSKLGVNEGRHNRKIAADFAQKYFSPSRTGRQAQGERAAG